MDIFDFDRRDPYHRAASLEDLCRFSDANFIRCAFVTILGRQPDPDGEAHYLDGLRRGTSKLGIISDLRVRSEEHTSELQSLMRTSYAVFCLKKKRTINNKKQS